MTPFLQPLSAEEEAMYLHLLHHGNEEQACEAKNQLIEHNMRLVAHVVKKYQSAEEDLDECISIGTLGLIKAILSYDESKGSKLGTYAARCIENELLMMIRNKKKKQREISLQEPVGVDSEGNELKLMDLLVGDSKDPVEEMYHSHLINKAMEYLNSSFSSREQTILNMRYGLLDGKEYTQKDIGDILHISRSYVSRIEKKALMKLRYLLETEE